MVALTLITFVTVVILVVMISSFKRDTRRNLKVINNQIKKLQKQFDGQELIANASTASTGSATTVTAMSSASTSSEKKETPKESLETSGQKYIPKSVLDKISKQAKEAK
ncbi:hypothetical protein JYT74_02505 [Crocinitomix catalasitica]|nr:hypothetical protein [Crocinitomix catalasitica]